MPAGPLLLVEREFFWQLKLTAREVFDVDVLEPQHPHRIHEPVGAADNPHPDILPREIKIEVVFGVLPYQIDLIRQIKPTLSLHNVRKLRHDVAIFSIEG